MSILPPNAKKPLIRLRGRGKSKLHEYVNAVLNGHEHPIKGFVLRILADLATGRALLLRSSDASNLTPARHGLQEKSHSTSPAATSLFSISRISQQSTGSS
jgi:hypothetical protein